MFKCFNKQMVYCNELLKNGIGKINKIIRKLKNETFFYIKVFGENEVLSIHAFTAITN